MHLRKYGKSIHIECWSTSLDGHKTHHEAFEVHNELQIMSQRQGYYFEKILKRGLGGRCKRVEIHHRVHVLCGHWCYFVKMQKTTNHCIIYNRGEHMVTSYCTKEAIWLRQLLAYVEFVQERATPIMCDNPIIIVHNFFHVLLLKL